MEIFTKIHSSCNSSTEFLKRYESKEGSGLVDLGGLAKAGK
jgi:hypothetical protein